MNQLRRALLGSIPSMFVGGAFTKLVSSGVPPLVSAESLKLSSSFASNSALPTILPGWSGTPRDSSGSFVNHEFPLNNDFIRVFEWQFSPNPQREEKKRDTFKLRVIRDTSFLKTDADCIVWFGHASFFIRVGGLSFFTDPVFGNVPFKKRLISLPLSPDELKNLDFLLLSHTHQDHADESSMSYLAKRNQSMQYLCGLESDELVRDWTGSKHIQSAGWYQEYDSTNLRGGLNAEIFYLPARHWSRRGIFDQNKKLWGSFVIRANGKTIFFSGDTGNGSHFRQVAELFGKVDVCIIGVGAYKPEWFMSQNHISPRNAVIAAETMKATTMIPMHYATFDLGDEPPGDPVRVLEKIRREEHPKTDILIPHVGEVVKI